MAKDAFSPEKLNHIKHQSIFAIAEWLRCEGCEVLVPYSLYRIGDRIFSYRELAIHTTAILAFNAFGRVLQPQLVEQAIVAYQMAAGTTPITFGLRERLCAPETVDREKAYLMAREIASWAWFTAPPVLASEKEAAIHESAHCLLRWVENCKRRILGQPVHGQQIMLFLYGIGGTLKSSIASAIIAPLGPLGGKLGNPDNVLSGHDGALMSTKVAVFWDECFGMAPRHLDGLKDLVTARQLRANPKGKDAIDIDILASIIATSNPPPVMRFPDAAMLRRLGSICFSFQVPETDQERYMREYVFPFDMTGFWQAVDPVGQSDKATVARNQARHRFKTALEQFLTEHVERVSGEKVTLKEVFDFFMQVALANNWKDSKTMTTQALSALLRLHGYDMKRTNKGVTVMNMRLHEEPRGASETALGEAV